MLYLRNSAPMLVLRTAPRIFNSAFNTKHVLRVIALEKNRLHLFPQKKKRRGCCTAAEVSAGTHVESFREKDSDSKGVASRRTDVSRKKFSEGSGAHQGDVSNGFSDEVNKPKAKSRKKPAKLQGVDEGSSQKLPDESGSLKTPGKRVIRSDEIEDKGLAKTPVAGRRKKSSESPGSFHSHIIPADETNEEPSAKHADAPRGSNRGGQTEADAVGLDKNTTRSTCLRRRKKKETQEEEFRSVGAENLNRSPNLYVNEEVPQSSRSLDREGRSADSKHLEEDASLKVLQNATFSAEEQEIFSVKHEVPGETQTPELQANATVEYSGELQSNPTVQYSGVPEPLYMQIEKRRLEEQQKRAGNSSKKKKYSPVSELRFTLDYCSKFGDVNGALAAYEAHKQAIPFDLYNFNVLLYLCSSAALGVLIPFKRSKQRPDYGENEFGLVEEGEVEVDGVVLRGNMAGLSGKNEMGFSGEMLEMFLRRGLEVYEEMREMRVAPDDATFTSLARLAVAKLDGDLAFDIVREMVSAGLAPKLRCYGPALFIYFKRSDASKALEVYNHMLAHGVEPDEAELEILLHLASKAGLSDEVYSLLHQLRRTVRDVSPSTVSVIERWFSSGFAAGARSNSMAGELEVLRASAEKGGGWHGLGWLGAGAWNVDYTQLSPGGVCCNCGEQMITIDVDPLKTEIFAESIASLASKREHGYSFGAFKDWLDRNEPYETIVDGANVGFHNQRGEELNFAQLNSVVSEIYRGTGRWPLVILHVKRTATGSGRSVFAQQLLRKLSIANALYTTPTGSNDDWYWLYAAVKCKSLLVSNDEMRDHIFQLLGRDYFPTWKERHQVRFHVSDRAPNFYMPPPYSIIIQESVRGSWHVPVSDGDDISTPRKWLCVTRPSHQAL